MSETLQGRRLTIADLKIPRTIAPQAAPPQPRSPAAPASAKDRKPVETLIETTIAPPAPPREAKPTPAARQPCSRRLTKSQKQRRKQRRRFGELLVIYEAEVRALRARLVEAYPAAFTQPPRPLKVGITNDILADLQCDKAMLSLTMKNWCTHPDYMRALSAGATRFDLDGAACGLVTAEDQRAQPLRGNVRASGEGGEPS